MYAGDNQDGTYTNPILFADYPDVDVIRVGEDFYMVSSSFQKMPGIPICRSKDLVNWSLIGYAYDKLELSPDYDMQNGKNRYGGGTWAPTLRYHPKIKRFYIAACSNQEGEGLLIFSSGRPEGPYEMTVLKEWFYDPGLLIDGDGRMYVYHGRDTVYMSELSADGTQIISPPVEVYRNEYRSTLEGTHAYHIGEYYYLSVSLCGKNGMKMICRSKNPTGPFEARVVGNDGPNRRDCHCHQGGFVDTPQGDWYYILFQDIGHIGRCPSLQPLNWVEGWPVTGDLLRGGRMVTTGRMPVAPQEQDSAGPLLGGPLGGNDEFDRGELSRFWQWNHNPLASHYSLTERPGFLRLKAVYAQTLPQARNMVTQRTVGLFCAGSVRIDPAGLQERDVAGLAMTNQCKPYSFCGVSVMGGQHFLVQVINDRCMRRVPLMQEETVELKITLDEYGIASHFYRTDERDAWIPVGEPLETVFSGKTYMGYSFGLFCFTREAEGGYADFDWFRLEQLQKISGIRSAFEKTSAYLYDSCHDVQTRRCGRHYYGYELCSIGRGSHVCFDRVDFGEGADWFQCSAAAPRRGGRIELYLDAIYGDKIGELAVEGTDGPGLYRSMICEVKKVSGIHKLYLRFDHADFAAEMFTLDWFRFGKNLPY